MNDLTLFMCAAIVLAISPGPGMLYVLTRSLANGSRDGWQSCAGTFAGGMLHVVAAGCGLSAILATSAIAFSVIKYAGAAYLVFLGIQMILKRGEEYDQPEASPRPNNPIIQGFATEALNPKTALFFLSLIPQFVVRTKGHIFLQVCMLGFISVTLNTLADMTIVFFAVPLGRILRKSESRRRKQRVLSGATMIGLGAYAMFSNHQTHTPNQLR